MTAVPVTATAAPTLAEPTTRRRRRHGGNTQTKAGPLTYVILVVVAFVSIFPLYWTMVAASRTNAEINEVPPPFIPGSSFFSNLREAFQQAQIVKALVNTVIVAGSIAAGTVLFCTLAGFAFARLRFRFSTALFGLTIGTMMIPPQLGIIPLYMIMVKIGWVDQLPSVILPTLVSAFGVFFMRQYIESALPVELLEAGWIDGASTFRIFRSIVLPVARPAMSVLAMLTFLTAWNDFFWPIIILSADNPTVQVALNNLGQGYVPDRSVIMAGTFLCTIPVIVVFALLGKQIVGGIMNGAVKG